SPRRWAPAVFAADAHPVSARRRLAISSGTPARASSTAPGRPCWRTRPSCGRSSVASSAVATRTNSGAPNGAAASIRADAGGASLSALTSVSPVSTVVERSLPSGFLLRVPNLLVDVAWLDRVAVARERARPGCNCVVVSPELEEDVTVVVLDNRVGFELIGG